MKFGSSFVCHIYFSVDALKGKGICISSSQRYLNLGSIFVQLRSSAPSMPPCHMRRLWRIFRFGTGIGTSVKAYVFWGCCVGKISVLNICLVVSNVFFHNRFGYLIYVQTIALKCLSAQNTANLI